ncbi:MAG: hypothetical protein WD894_04980 [Pirellulales bacterium]
MNATSGVIAHEPLEPILNPLAPTPEELAARNRGVNEEAHRPLDSMSERFAAKRHKAEVTYRVAVHRVAIGESIPLDEIERFVREAERTPDDFDRHRGRKARRFLSWQQITNADSDGVTRVTATNYLLETMSLGRRHRIAQQLDAIAIAQTNRRNASDTIEALRQEISDVLDGPPRAFGDPALRNGAVERARAHLQDRNELLSRSPIEPDPHASPSNEELVARQLGAKLRLYDQRQEQIEQLIREIHEREALIEEHKLLAVHKWWEMDWS